MAFSKATKASQLGKIVRRAGFLLFDEDFEFENEEFPMLLRSPDHIRNPGSHPIEDRGPLAKISSKIGGKIRSKIGDSLKS